MTDQISCLHTYIVVTQASTKSREFYTPYFCVHQTDESISFDRESARIPPYFIMIGRDKRVNFGGSCGAHEISPSEESSFLHA